MEWLLDLLFPKYCLNCRQFGSYICATCMAKVGRGRTEKKIVSLWKYEGIIKKAIWALKYQFAYQMGGELADRASEEISSRGYFAKKDFIFTSIPLHIKRERWRGFNQTEIIGKCMAQNLRWAFDSKVLLRSKQATTQVGQHKKERLRNIRGNFAVNSEAKEKIKGKMIIVFDDVATTGATLSEVSKILKKAGAGSVWGLTLAR